MSDNRFGDPGWDDGNDVDAVGERPIRDERPRADEDHDDDEIETLLVTVSNPEGTVTVTALMSGQVMKVALSPQVTRFTESQLAEEIAFLATLARKQAQAAQHSFAAAFMRRLGHDPAGTRALLEHDLGLPAPHSVLAEKAQAFAARYQDQG